VFEGQASKFRDHQKYARFNGFFDCPYPGKQSAVAKSVQKVFTGGTAYGLEGRAKTCGRRLF